MDLLPHTVRCQVRCSLLLTDTPADTLRWDEATETLEPWKDISSMQADIVDSMSKFMNLAESDNNALLVRPAANACRQQNCLTRLPRMPMFKTEVHSHCFGSAVTVLTEQMNKLRHHPLTC